MKRFILTGLSLFMVTILVGQEPATSQCKQAYTTLNISLDKLKSLTPGSFSYKAEIDKATKKIELIKKNEPKFDLREKEQLLQNYVNAQEDALAATAADEVAADEASLDANALHKEMDELFKGPGIADFQNGADLGLATDAEQRLSLFKEKTEAFIMNKASDRISRAKEYGRYNEPKCIYYERAGLEDVLKRIDGYMRNAIEIDVAMAHYYLIRKYEIYWNTLEKALPGDMEVKLNAELSRKYSAGLPSVADMQASVGSNKKKLLDSVEVPKAIRSDAPMELQFRNAFIATGWDETIFQINLLDTDWHIERNSLTGAIIGRYQSAAITTKNVNGDCILYTFFIMQDYNGSGYQSTARRESHNSTYISCDKVH